mmetsp:Transcript_9850/g.19182  ORF Transcript_9850/g.19182 Transcript_9850/m.19182 type:complete len:223 (-) Transcript_9850:559-1227(-)
MYQSSLCPLRLSARPLAHSMVLRSFLMPSRMALAAALRRSRSFLWPSSAFFMAGRVSLSILSYAERISFSMDSSCVLSFLSSAVFLFAAAASLASADPRIWCRLPICFRSALSRGAASLLCQSLSCFAASSPSLMASILTAPRRLDSSVSPLRMIVMSSMRSLAMDLTRNARSSSIPLATLLRNTPSRCFCSARSFLSVLLMSATSDAMVAFLLFMSGVYLA